jgi:hypothetical protein
MLAYLFWHVPDAGTDTRDYETALLGFQASLARRPSPGLIACATFRISPVPWLDNRAGYEDWCLLDSSAALDPLNAAAIDAQHADAHAAIAGKMDFGHGGLYAHFHGGALPLAGARVLWLRRPRGIQYQEPLRAMIDKAPGFLSCWRRQMVLGPAEEFAVVGSAQLALSLPAGWQARAVERTQLSPASAQA